MGPPGTGKTTLVANYIELRKLPCLWYQLDEGDGDVASFFHYLSLAMQIAAPKYRKSLPHFTAEYRISLNTFTRRFFEELYARLEVPSLLVFDNYHDLPPDSRLHEALEAALEQVPESVTWVFMSRQLPPPSLAKLQAQQAVHIFDSNALRLTSEEAAELVQLHAKQCGWATTRQARRTDVGEDIRVARRTGVALGKRQDVGIGNS
jgi:ATP/maltotriose-dependent transcriptional regulator MalT